MRKLPPELQYGVLLMSFVIGKSLPSRIQWEEAVEVSRRVRMQYLTGSDPADEALAKGVEIAYRFCSLDIRSQKHPIQLKTSPSSDSDGHTRPQWFEAMR